MVYFAPVPPGRPPAARTQHRKKLSYGRRKGSESGRGAGRRRGGVRGDARPGPRGAEEVLAANRARIPLAKMAVEETGMGIVEDKVVKNHYAAE